MYNSMLLVFNLVFLYSLCLLFYKMFGDKGLICWTVLATIAANIEVMILVNAFGMQQTLGNIMFATTFVVTDILSEVSGKKKANYAVNIGIATSIAFILISQFWLLYIPSDTDWAFESIKLLFANTPRFMIAGLVVYAIVQKFDVFIYHKIWNRTASNYGRKKFLWLRNNASTLVSQLLNAILFTSIAFGGMYDLQTMLSIMASSYVIFIVTSICDTPVVYLARWLKNNNYIMEEK